MAEDTIFDDDFWESVGNDDSCIILQKMCERYRDFHSNEGVKATSELEVYNKALASFGALKAYAARLEMDATNFAEAKYAVMFAGETYYELKESDLKRLQTLINELRDLIVKSDEFGDDHKDPLLKRLEKLQSELHKRMSDFDSFWGTWIEITGHVGTMAKNLKPVTDRLKEMAEIVTKAMKIWDGWVALPSPDNAKQLPGPDDD